MAMVTNNTMALAFSVKIYGEGKTEWFYFDGIREIGRFRFSLEPAFPKSSRSSYKQNLKLIDKELKKHPEERANVIFLIIDTDTLVQDEKQYREYLVAKEKYGRLGVFFIESHPCIELWFVYHLWERFSKTSYATFSDMEPLLKMLLPGYDKSDKYYRSNRTFRTEIIESYRNRGQAIFHAIKSCKYEPIENEVVNSSEIFKVIQLFRLLQKFTEIRNILTEVLHQPISLTPVLNDCQLLKIVAETDGKASECCTLKYRDAEMQAIVGGQFIGTLDDTEQLTKDSDFVKRMTTLLNKN